MAVFSTLERSQPQYDRDGLFHVTVQSPSLGRRADLTMWQPDVDQQLLPLVILLHGIYASHWYWSSTLGAHETASALIRAGEMPPMALVMPSDGLWGEGSGYLRHDDADYEAWIIDDVISAAQQCIPGVTADSPVFIAGLSMGGYGALRLGAKYPHLFRGMSGLSSVTDLETVRRNFPELFEKIHLHGDNGAVSVAAWMITHRDQLPPVRFDCGTEDFLIADNRALHHALVQANIPHVYLENAGGHDKLYWQMHIEDTFRFFAAQLKD